MSIQFNKLTFNGKSTADFPFDIFVQENDGINKAKRKVKLFSSNAMSGAIAKDYGTYETVDKVYKFYVKSNNTKDFSLLMSWLEGQGQLIASDNPERYYEVLDVSAVKSRLDEVDGYEFDVTFTCNPFSLPLNDDVRIFESNGVLDNNSGYVMYPKVTVYGNSETPTTLTIGKQVIHLKKIDTEIIIECQHGKQNIYDKQGFLLNSIMKGNFFEVQKGKNGVVLGNGISKIEILCRWGELV